MNKRGFSLIEVMVAVGMFLGVSVLIFAFFRYGVRSFAQANQKHGMQMDALRTIESLQMELKRSTLASVLRDAKDNTSARTISVDGEDVQRDVISFATLENFRDINNSENYDRSTGAPLWNRYWIYYATTEPEGRIIRMKVAPDPPPEGPLPLRRSDFDRLHYDNPGTNTFEGENPQYVVLAKNVYHFSIEKSGGSFLVFLKLREKHQKEAVKVKQRREYDYYEMKVSITPENSFPNDL